MGPSETERVLDRFYRSGNGGGYGLGLAIVREVARAMDGEVSTRQSRTPAPLWSRPRTCGDGMSRLLVVDDERDILETLAFALQREGFEIVTAETGPDALERARAATFDVVILDVMLPGLSGLRTSAAPFATRANVPILLLTQPGTQRWIAFSRFSPELTTT